MCIAFDDLCARARYAIEVNGWPPALGDGPLTIRNGRHPLLVPASPPDRLSAMRRGGTTAVPRSPSPDRERRSGGEDKQGDTSGPVVPFDLTLAPDEFTLLVSGPNT